MAPILMRVEYNEPLDLDLSAERDDVGERWVIMCHKVDCGTQFVYPDDSYADTPQEIGEVAYEDVDFDSGETEWDDLTPVQRERIIELWQNEE